MSIFTMSTEVLASSGCDGVNAGGFNRTNYTPPGSGTLDTESGFDIGDTINFTVSGLTGSSFELINGALNTVLLIQPLAIMPTSLSYTVTGVNDDTTLNTNMLVQAIPFEISITATCIPVSTPIARLSGELSTKAINSFLMNRINSLLLNQPSNMSLRTPRATSLGDLQGTPSALTMRFNNTVDMDTEAHQPLSINQQSMLYGKNLSAFSNNSRSLSSKMQPIHFRQALSETIQYLQKPDSSVVMPARFDAWSEAYYTEFNNNQARAAREGHAFVGYIGADYRINDGLLIGALAQFDSTKESSSILTTSVNGKGWMSGPYLSARLYRNIFLDLRAAGGRSLSNHLEIDDVGADFDTSRWLIISRLSGDWHKGPWRFTPMTDVAYIEEAQKGFTNSQGTAVPGQQVSLGRMAFGPEIGYSTEVGVASVQPYSSLKGIWNFNRSTAPLISAELITIDSILGPLGTNFASFWGQIGAGVGVLMPMGTMFRLGLVYDGIGANNYHSLTMLGQLSAPLS